MKAAGLVATSARAEILDMGAARFDGRAVIDITACEVASGDEKYVIIAQGSNSSTFANTVVNLGALPLGDSTTSLETADTAATSRREIMFSNQVDGTIYRYVSLYTQVVGTIATGINFSAVLTTKA